MDNIDGKCDLEYGIMSTGAVCVLNDESSIVLEEDGSVAVSEKREVDTGLHKNDILKWLDAFLADTAAEYLLKEAIFENLSKMDTVADKLIYIGQNAEDNNLRLALQEIIMNEEA